MYLYENLDREFWILLDRKHIYFLESSDYNSLPYTHDLLGENTYDKIPVKVVVNDNDYMDYNFFLLDGTKVTRTWITNFGDGQTNLVSNPDISVKSYNKTGPRNLSLVKKQNLTLEDSVCIDNYIGLLHGVCWDMPYTAYRSYDNFPYCNDKLGKVLTEKEALEYIKNHEEEVKNFLTNVELAQKNLLKYNEMHMENNSKIIVKKK